MSVERLREGLERRAPGQWELYRKSGRSRETLVSPRSRQVSMRREEGWAARWFEGNGLHFASGSGPEELERAIDEAAAVSLSAGPRLDWPTARNSEPAGEPTLEPPPELFEEISTMLAAESRGEGRLTQLAIRRGLTIEKIENARGLDVTIATRRLDGVAHAAGHRGNQSCEARALFRWDGPPDVASVARRLCDAAVLPLSMQPSPVSRGEWLLEPAVGAFLLASLAPIFLGARIPKWINRSRFCAAGISLIDDASADAPFDGEGTPTRRVILVENGELRGRLRDLESAAASGAASTGHGVRPSYRTPPTASPRRLFFEAADSVAPLDLLATVRRGLFASALTAPIRVDLDADRYEVEFTGVSIVGGRAQGPVAGARARGRISRLLQDIAGSATDRKFLPVPYPAGTPTLLIGRAQFD
ncbi:MAG TPA: metallopeptidase TldD-related protein [Thermoanaerobaculia bacterium]